MLVVDAENGAVRSRQVNTANDGAQVHFGSSWKAFVFYLCVCVCVCARACVRAVCVRVCACVRACVRGVCVCVPSPAWYVKAF